MSHFFHHIDPHQGGLIVCDATDVYAAIKKCRSNGYTGLLIGDPMSYTKKFAEPDDPFWLDSNDDQLFGLTLNDVLRGQIEAGADWAVIPTGYIGPGQRDAFKAAVREAASVERDDTIFAAPLDIAWFSDAYIDQTVAILSRLSLPKAVYLGSQGDPLKTFTAEPVTNLRRLVHQVKNISVFSTDLEAFDVLAHGATAASIGTGGALRHIVRPDQEPESPRPRSDRSPTLLIPDLAAFLAGSTIYKRFANTSAPTCACPACAGRALDTFLDGADRKAAQQHGVATWTTWLKNLVEQERTTRSSWWKSFCQAAIDAHDTYNITIRQRNVFKPPKALRLWAELPQ
ncbi:hypothetical protein [Rhizohabitans arisaemae]|uniref:hypothetical protein n=1 Tax=Rhizohabitans arisaemae TaxID=2720610 RepID=UPI0024B05714|nr:hypothetical protein [Rhizohabitans arisaemae]